jgi:thiol-disulfide isomerase/thioredoxin
LESDPGANETERAARAKLSSTYKVEIVEGRVELLEKQGKKDEAIALLTATAEDETLDASARRSLNAKVAQAKIIGTQAPEIPVEHVLGEFTSLQDLKGKVVLVDFFAHWCGPCVASFPALRDLHKEFADRGLQIVHVTRSYGFFAQTRGISVDDEIDKMREFKRDHELDWPVVFTNDAPYSAYGVTGIPHLAMIDRNGKVRYVKVGFSQAMVPELKSQIEKLLAESSN